MAKCNVNVIKVAKVRGKNELNAVRAIRMCRKNKDGLLKTVVEAWETN